MPTALSQAKEKLAEQYQSLLIHCGVDSPSSTVSSRLVPGTDRHRVTDILIAEGYITKDREKYVVTSKAWDEIDPEPIDEKTWLEGERASSRTDPDDFIPFDRLTQSQQKYAVLNTSTFQFLLVSSVWWNCVEKAEFALGNSAPAGDKLGNKLDLKVVITSDNLKAHHLAYRRDNFRQKCLERNLNLFLYSKGFTGKVPIVKKDQSPLFGDEGISYDIGQWEASFDSTTEAIVQRINESRARLEALQDFALLVVREGGWDKFKEQYRTAVEQFVVDNFNNQTNIDGD